MSQRVKYPQYVVDAFERLCDAPPRCSGTNEYTAMTCKLSGCPCGAVYGQKCTVEMSTRVFLILDEDRIRLLPCCQTCYERWKYAVPRQRLVIGNVPLVRGEIIPLD
jgi:hypothetical protein